MFEPSLHEVLTNLLLQEGCTVNKTAIDKLLEFIAARESETFDKIGHYMSDVKMRLEAQTRVDK